MYRPLSRRHWLGLSSAIVTTHAVGCAESNPAPEPVGHMPPEVLERSPPSDLQDARLEVSRALAKVYATPLPHRFPNWIAFHSLLMHGESAFAAYVTGEADENLRRIFGVILKSSTRELGPYVIRGDLPYPRHSGPYFSQEHHPGQFLNYFSMGGGSVDAVIEVDGAKYTVLHLLSRSMLEARPAGELAYLVLAYSYFLEPRRRWENKFGEEMSLALLLEVLLKTPEKTCLGTHRLAAMARTLSREELRKDDAINELWPELERQVNQALAELKQSHRPDGGFVAPGLAAGSTSPRHQDIFYAGHSLEWMTLLDRNYERGSWFVKAIKTLASGVAHTCVTTFQSLDAIGDTTAHFDFDGLTHAVSALRRWHDKSSQ
jgi:hypothetical protein